MIIWCFVRKDLWSSESATQILIFVQPYEIIIFDGGGDSWMVIWCFAVEGDWDENLTGMKAWDPDPSELLSF